MEKGKIFETLKVVKYESPEKVRIQKPYDVLESVCESGINCLLGGGITQIWNLLINQNANHYNAAQMGIGSTPTAAIASQTNLLDASAEWVAMSLTYPSVAGSVITFQSKFGIGIAVFHWQEFAIRQAGVGSIVLNRIVSDKGTKIAGEIWTASIQITIR